MNSHKHGLLSSQDKEFYRRISKELKNISSKLRSAANQYSVLESRKKGLDSLIMDEPAKEKLFEHYNYMMSESRRIIAELEPLEQKYRNTAVPNATAYCPECNLLSVQYLGKKGMLSRKDRYECPICETRYTKDRKSSGLVKIA